MWKKDGTPRRFLPGERGLYYYNMKETEGTILTTIYTVAVNKENYTRRQIQHAKSTRKFQNCIGVTTTELICVIDKQMMINCTLNRQLANDVIDILVLVSPIYKAKLQAQCHSMYIYNK